MPHGSRPVKPRSATSAGRGDVPHAARILQTNVYGWFERVGRGVYALSPRGQLALAEDRAVSAPSVPEDAEGAHGPASPDQTPSGLPALPSRP